MEQIKIGDQIWSSKNLDVDTFRNGDPIPHAETEEQWEEAGENLTPAWCYYENDLAYGEEYGKLYNWHAVNDPRGLAPEGWHVPSDDEWTTLTDHLGGVDVAGTKMNVNGTNESGFSGLPGGSRGYDGAFDGIFGFASWWSSSGNYTDGAWFRFIFQNDEVYRYNTAFVDDDMGNGFSVRCLRD